MVVAITTAAGMLTAFIVEWGQRHCELWAQARDRNL
jgi:hypothetical protein